jgi:RNA polymerase sigma-70 factor, ECF subfamily
VDDDTAIRALYDRYRRPLFGFVLRSVGGDHQYAEDIVQETMTRAWAHSADLDPDRAGGWLFTDHEWCVVFHAHGGANRVTFLQISSASG